MSEANNFCVKCGANLGLDNDFCPKCGSSANSDVSPQRTIRKKRVSKKSTKLWYVFPIFLNIVGGVITYFILRDSDPRKARNCLFIGSILFIFFIIMIAVIAVIGSSTVEEQQTPRVIEKEAPRVIEDTPRVIETKNIVKENQETTSTSNRELQAKSVDWTYESLLRNGDYFEGKIIHLTGRVMIPTEHGFFGIDVGDSGISRLTEDDIIFVEYDEERFFENDLIELFGKVDGDRKLLWTSLESGVESTEMVPNLVAIKVICSNC